MITCMLLAVSLPASSHHVLPQRLGKAPGSRTLRTWSNTYVRNFTVGNNSTRAWYRTTTRTVFGRYHYHNQSVFPFAVIDRGNCGHSLQEARANNCVFDIILSGWAPNPWCGQELSDSVLAVNNFTYWSSKVGRQESSEEYVQKGNFDILYTHGMYPTEHCL